MTSPMLESVIYVIPEITGALIRSDPIALHTGSEQMTHDASELVDELFKRCPLFYHTNKDLLDPDLPYCVFSDFARYTVELFRSGNTDELDTAIEAIGQLRAMRGPETAPFFEVAMIEPLYNESAEAFSYIQSKSTNEVSQLFLKVKATLDAATIAGVFFLTGPHNSINLKELVSSSTDFRRELQLREIAIDTQGVLDPWGNPYECQRRTTKTGVRVLCVISRARLRGFGFDLESCEKYPSPPDGQE